MVVAREVLEDVKPVPNLLPGLLHVLAERVHAEFGVIS